MVRKKSSFILCGAFLFVAWNALLLLYLWGRPPMGQVNLAGEVIRLAEEVEIQLDTQKKLLKQIESHRAVWARQKEIGKKQTDNIKEVNPIAWCIMPGSSLTRSNQTFAAGGLVPLNTDQNASSGIN
uniref:Uncharacterized protein n=1 Tax=Neolamprologus brichardi TaxID=32507 RepID=A0A3Q4G4W5_NEOBR